MTRVGLLDSAALRRADPVNLGSLDTGSRKVEPNMIRETRKALRLSQEQLAREADCSTVYVRLLESGYAPGASDVVPRILAVLKEKRPGSAGQVALTNSAGTGRHGPE